MIAWGWRSRVFSHCYIGRYFAPFIVITVIVIVVVFCVAVALFIKPVVISARGFVFHSLCGGGGAAAWSQTVAGTKPPQLLIHPFILYHARHIQLPFSN